MYIVIDIGGTKTRVGTCPDLNTAVEIVDKFSTPPTPEAGMKKIVEHIADLDTEIKAVAVGIAGVVDRASKQLLSSPNLSDWINHPLADHFEEIVDTKNVLVVNDTDLGGLGEATAGAGTKDGITAYLTVGTGVGGSRIVDGKIDAARFGFEPGHQVIDISDFLDTRELPPEGHIPGHLEYYISGHNIQERTGQRPTDVHDEKMWSEFQERLIAALNNVIVMWSPDVIVMGGSMIIRNEYLSFAYMQKALEKKVKIFPEVPTLQRAVLQDEAGLIGAQELLRQHLE